MNVFAVCKIKMSMKLILETIQKDSSGGGNCHVVDMHDDDEDRIPDISVMLEYEGLL